MVELTKSEELDVAGKAAFCLACHALDSPVGPAADAHPPPLVFRTCYDSRMFRNVLISWAAKWIKRGLAGEACDQDA
jgi:hypothetical protein